MWKILVHKDDIDHQIGDGYTDCWRHKMETFSA